MGEGKGAAVQSLVIHMGLSIGTLAPDGGGELRNRYHPHPNLPPSRGKEVQRRGSYREENFASSRGISTIPEGHIKRPDGGGGQKDVKWPPNF